MKKIIVMFILAWHIFFYNINCFAIQTYTDSTGQQQIYTDGSDLLRACKDSVNAMDGNYSEIKDPSFELNTLCSADIAGFMQGYKTDRNTICFPPGVTLEQNIRVVYAYVNNHPEKLNIAWDQLIIEAFSTAFPCK